MNYNGKNDAHTLEHTGTNDYQSLPKGGKLKRHFKRFWWLHLINFLIGVLIVTLILVFVGMPDIAQKDVNKARLTLESQIVSNPQPNSVHLYMNVTSHSDSMYHPHLDSFRAALFLEDTLPDLKPFGYLQIPAIKSTKAATIIIDQDMQVEDMEQFIRYNAMVLGSEEYRVAQRGRMGLKEGSFPKTTVDFNKVITSKGLNNLKGFEVRDIEISLTPGPDGSNLKGKVFIPNPSPITIDMGTITQNVMVNGQQIGVATIPSLRLVPGDNLVDMSSVSDQAKVLTLVTSQYTDGKLPITLVGNSSTVNGVEIPYFSKPLQAQRLETTLDLGPAFKKAGIDLSKLSGGGLGGLGAPKSSSAAPASAPPPSATPAAP